MFQACMENNLKAESNQEINENLLLSWEMNQAIIFVKSDYWIGGLTTELEDKWWKLKIGL